MDTHTIFLIDLKTERVVFDKIKAETVKGAETILLKMYPGFVVKDRPETPTVEAPQSAVVFKSSVRSRKKK